MNGLITLLERFREGYDRLYARLCGSPPGPLRPWHHLWLATVDVHRDLREVLGSLEGRVLDVGCGQQPYRDWLAPGASYFGVDVMDEGGADALIVPGERWPLEDASFDAVLCTQVLEHDSDPGHTLAEIRRVLKPGGRLVSSVPFAYNEHAMPHDYRRFSANGLRLLLEDAGFEVGEVRKQGLAGSTVGILWLNWLGHLMGRSRALQVLRAVLFPLWILYTGIVNVWARAVDALDRTGAFYSNVMAVARKPTGPRPLSTTR